MKAAPDAQLRLLDLQAVDTAVAQLKHRRASLPETAKIKAAQAERSALSEQVVAVRTRVSDLEVEQARSESDLEPVKARRERNQKRVDAGEISDPRALRSMLDEIEHLGRRIGDLEDAQLEVMERLEASQGELAELTERRAADDVTLRELLAQRDAAVGAIDAELAERSTERVVIARDIPTPLLDLYAKVAGKSGGLGAAPLRQGRCGGCQLELTHADLASYRAAAPDEVLRCEECNRILVRTPDSGL